MHLLPQPIRPKAQEEEWGKSVLKGEFTSEVISDIEHLCNAVPELKQWKKISELQIYLGEKYPHTARIKGRLRLENKTSWGVLLVDVKRSTATAAESKGKPSHKNQTGRGSCGRHKEVSKPAGQRSGVMRSGEWWGFETGKLSCRKVKWRTVLLSS